MFVFFFIGDSQTVTPLDLEGSTLQAESVELNCTLNDGIFQARWLAPPFITLDNTQTFTTVAEIAPVKYGPGGTIAVSRISASRETPLILSMTISGDFLNQDLNIPELNISCQGLDLDNSVSGESPLQTYRKH